MTSRTARLWLAAALLVAPVLSHAQTPSFSLPPPSLGAHNPAATGDDEIIGSFKLREADIDSVLSELEDLTGRSVVRPGVLPTASYTITIDRPIPKGELITALETLLALNQVGVSPMGSRFLKVTALSQVKSESPEMIAGSSLDLPESGKICTKLFELQFLRVSEFAPQVQQLLSPGVNGGAVQLEKANAMIVTDTVSNIQRVERLLKELDQPHEEGLIPKFYTMEYAKASDLVSKLHTMLSGAAQNELRATTSYSADDRTNQIILIADPREYPLFDSLISRLDVRSDPNTTNEVIYLKHADAKDVSTLLSQLISGQNTAAQKTGAQSVSPGQVVAGQRPANSTGGDTGTTNEFSSFITIQPDVRTNSIVVSGTSDDLRLIKNIIEKIDILLSQVRIEVVIAEVTFDDSSNSGINTGSGSGPSLLIGTAPNGGTSVIGATGGVAGLGVTSLASLAGAGTSIAAAGTGATAAALAGAAGFSTLNPANVVATLSSLGAITKTKILQESTIVTTHNKEAMITVTDQVPVITSSTSTPAASTTTTSSFDTNSSVSYKDIGITLKVTPLIGDDGSIQLKVDQTVDDLGSYTQINGNNEPNINHRQATSFVNVMDDQLVVLGGFQSSTKSISRQRFGILYEIPVLSNLLGYRSNDTSRTELLLFLKPHVIPNDTGTKDAVKVINGMGNKDQINKYLKDPTRIPDAEMSLKEKLQ